MIVSVIVPGLNAEATLPACLDALAASTIAPVETIFFDDGSSDASGAIARAAGIRVIRNDGAPLGPAVGRNRAARTARGEILVFVDADVIVHPDAIGRLLAALEDGDVAAAFGSYDASPPAKNLASLYMNLRHHAVHQAGRRFATTFWAGLGAIRRSDFEAVGAFSSTYGRPSIEDIELGVRLVAAGRRIRLVPEAQGSHAKHWSLGQLWRTDIFSRAIPWSRLIAGRRLAAADLNASASERRSAVLAHVAPATWLLAMIFAWASVPAALFTAAYLANNRGLYGVFWRAAPRRLLAAMVGLHWIYHIYASQIFAWTQLLYKLRPEPEA